MLRNRNLGLWSRLLILRRMVMGEVKGRIGGWIVGKYIKGNNLRSQAKMPKLTNQHIKQQDEIKINHHNPNHNKIKVNKKMLKKVIKTKAIQKINKLKMIK